MQVRVQACARAHGPTGPRSPSPEDHWPSAEHHQWKFRKLGSQHHEHHEDFVSARKPEFLADPMMLALGPEPQPAPSSSFRMMPEGPPKQSRSISSIRRSSCLLLGVPSLLVSRPGFKGALSPRPGPEARNLEALRDVAPREPRPASDAELRRRHCHVCFLGRPAVFRVGPRHGNLRPSSAWPANDSAHASGNRAKPPDCEVTRVPGC